MDINIIGAGPAGSYSAYLLAKQGHNVEVYEKDPEIGKPVQCTGILSDYFSTIMNPKKEFVENTVDKTRIYAPNGKYVEAKIKKNYVVCRKKFDNYIAGMAREEGANYHLNHSFNLMENKKGEAKIKINNLGKDVFSSSEILIGADGPLSPVAKSAGMYHDRKFVIGTQIEAKMQNDNVVEFYPYIGCYAWIVPKNEEVVRIGVASYKNAPELFRKFAKEKIGKNYEKKEIENQSGVIPVFDPRIKAKKDNIYLIGDSATFVKATSGGGINQSLKAAIALSDSINEEKDYDSAWRKSLYRNLHTHLIAHKMMQKFNENDWNRLVEAFSEEKMKSVLYSESRDRITSMLAKTAITNPFLLGYLKYFPFEELKNIF